MTWYIVGTGLANIVLTTITIFNIKEERFEKKLMQEEREREELRKRENDVEGVDKEEGKDGDLTIV